MFELTEPYSTAVEFSGFTGGAHIYLCICGKMRRDAIIEIFLKYQWLPQVSGG